MRDRERDRHKQREKKRERERLREIEINREKMTFNEHPVPHKIDIVSEVIQRYGQIFATLA